MNALRNNYKNSIAQDYQRGWEKAQREFLRQEKQNYAKDSKPAAANR